MMQVNRVLMISTLLTSSVCSFFENPPGFKPIPPKQYHGKPIHGERTHFKHLAIPVKTGKTGMFVNKRVQGSRGSRKNFFVKTSPTVVVSFFGKQRKSPVKTGKAMFTKKRVPKKFFAKTAAPVVASKKKLFAKTASPVAKANPFFRRGKSVSHTSKTNHFFLMQRKPVNEKSVRPSDTMAHFLKAHEEVDDNSDASIDAMSTFSPSDEEDEEESVDADGESMDDNSGASVDATTFGSSDTMPDEGESVDDNSAASIDAMSTFGPSEIMPVLEAESMDDNSGASVDATTFGPSEMMPVVEADEEEVDGHSAAFGNRMLSEVKPDFSELIDEVYPAVKSEAAEDGAYPAVVNTEAYPNAEVNTDAYPATTDKVEVAVAKVPHVAGKEVIKTPEEEASNTPEEDILDGEADATHSSVSAVTYSPLVSLILAALISLL